MSVRLRPEVRCTFDEDQAVLRVVQKETVGSEPSENATEQIMVYALKVRNSFLVVRRTDPEVDSERRVPYI